MATKYLLLCHLEVRAIVWRVDASLLKYRAVSEKKVLGRLRCTVVICKARPETRTLHAPIPLSVPAAPGAEFWSKVVYPKAL